MLRGIDVSHNNGKINWSSLTNIDFAIIRAGRGTGIDEQFNSNAFFAAKANIPYGVYWFCYALTVEQAIAEANCCLNTIKPYNLSLPVFYDFEYDTERYAKDCGISYTKNDRTAIIKAFCERIKNAGYSAGVYLNPDYIKTKVNWSELSGYILWLAKWTTNEYTSYEVPDTIVSKAFGQPLIWQFGLGKPMNGIKTDVDLDFGYFKISNSKIKDKGTTTENAETSKISTTISKGDTVKVVNYTIDKGKRRGTTYDGKSYLIYYGTYDVVSINDDRVVIGKGGKITAAVNISDLVKV